MMKNPEKYATETLNELLCAAVKNAADSGLLPDAPVPQYAIEQPKSAEHGDFSSNLALSGTKVYKLPPSKIAQIIVDNIELYGSPFDRCEIAGPGFINFFLSSEFNGSIIESILDFNDDYGKTTPDKPQKVMVEFVSANPTGPMHIGNARGGVIGDCLATCLSWAGNDVTREFYINDAGNQVERFSQSLLARYMQACGHEDYPFPEDGYHGEDVSVIARKFKDEYFDRFKDEISDKLVSELTAYGLKQNIAAMQRDLQKFGVEYDVWFYESSLHNSNQIEDTISILKDSNYTFEKDGAFWFKATEFGCEKDDVLVKTNGFYTYLAVDIAYHRNKFQMRGFDKVINVWGADHHGHVARLKGTMTAIGQDSSKLDVVLMQMVRLIRDGQQVKVSKRTGKSIKLTDLLEEMPLDSARFFFNLRSPDSHFDVDLDLAVSETSQNPVYYVQYAHARICSILTLLDSEGISTENLSVDFTLLSSPAEHELISQLSKFPQEIIQVTKSYDPSLITRYLIDLATSFHKFYTECRVRDAEAQIRDARIELLRATKQVIANGCKVLGISAPKKM